ncbi:MAG: hypothetical protein WEB60_08965, partial [Terrimicrobiaceae bacterium]
SSGQALEGLQPVRGYLPYNQLSSLLPPFTLPDEGGSAEDGGKEKREAGVHSAEPEKDRVPDIFRLSVDLSFREMIRLFLVPEHDRILSIRSGLRRERGVSELTFFIPVGDAPAALEKKREELYELQLQLFRTPTGIHCHIVL